MQNSLHAIEEPTPAARPVASGWRSDSPFVTNGIASHGCSSGHVDLFVRFRNGQLDTTACPRAPLRASSVA